MVARGPVLTVILTAATEGLDKGLSDAEAKLSSFGGGKGAGKLAGIAKVAAPIAGVAGTIVKLGKAGDQANTDVASFAAAMESLGAATGDQLDPALQAAIKGAQGMAFSGGAARDSLVSLQTATRDSAESARLLAIAQDVARLAGVDLTVASDAVAKAYAGQDRALRALLPGLPEAATGLESIAAAEQLAAGQSEIFAESAEGLGIKGKAAFKGIAISVGKALAPAVKALFEVLMPVLEIIGTLVNILLPLLEPLLKGIEAAFKGVAQVLDRVAGALQKVLGWVQKGIDGLQGLKDKVNELLGPLKDLGNINVFGRNAQGAAVGGGLTAGLTGTIGQSSHVAPVTINIYGDPSVIEAKVTKALRDYARRNGVGAVFTPNRD